METQAHLMKHLLKTVCQDVVNSIFEVVAAENLLTLADNESFNNEVWYLDSSFATASKICFK